jgi:hypothetical protein
MATLASRLSTLATRIATEFNTVRATLAARGAIASSGLTQGTGKLLGRTTASSGAIEEITPNSSDYILASAVLKNRIRITGGVTDKPADGQRLVLGKSPRAFTVTQANCSGQAKTAAAASAAFTLKKRTTGGTETTIGTFTFAASGSLATVSITAGAVGAGDMLFIEGPATADGTLADIAFLVSE